MCKWKPITDDILGEWGWDSPIVQLKDEEGNEAAGSYGFEDESDDDVLFAWHKENGDHLGFTPTHWREIV
jgi:hypothetical protein